MQHAMSPRQAQFPPITPVVFLKAVAAKRKYAAIGPDGVSRRDILHMPANTLASLVELLHRIELGAKWPTQATTGIVAALAKTAGAKTVGQYRPICVFSLFYRTWSSIRARQCLRHLMSIIPSSLMGNIPGIGAHKNLGIMFSS